MRRVISGITLVLLSVFLMALTGATYAAVKGPGWFNAVKEPVGLHRARAYYQSQQAQNTVPQVSSGTSVQSQTLIAAPQAASVSPFPDDIQAFARSLRNDPARIYEFVHDRIQYVPYFGYLKGPGLTLLERSGNDFDQAALMIELLRASGYTANFVYGQMTIPNYWGTNQRDMQHWLGVDTSADVISSVLGSGGIPASVGFFSTTLYRVWVQAVIDGVTYVFDPAFKVHTQTAGIDLAAAAGYSRADVLTAAGGEVGTDYVRNLNDTALRSKLAEYAGNLVTQLRANYPNAEMQDIVGGKTIVPEHLETLPTSIGFSTVVEEVWDSVPDVYVHKVRIQHGNIDNTLAMPSIGGYKLALDYTQSGSTATAAAATVEATATDASGSLQPEGAVPADESPLTLELQPDIAPTNIDAGTIILTDPDAGAAQPQAQAIAEPQAVQSTVNFGRVTPEFTSAQWPTW